MESLQQQEIKQEILTIINNMDNPYWITHIYKYLKVIEKKEN